MTLTCISYNIARFSYYVLPDIFSDWYPPPVTVHVGDNQSSSTSSYPGHRHHSLSRPASRSLSTQQTFPKNYTHSTHSSHRARSTTSPETQNGSCAQQLRSGYPVGIVHNSYHSNSSASFCSGDVIEEEPRARVHSASSGHECRPYTPSTAFTLTTLSQSPRVYPSRTKGSAPPLPPKGIKYGLGESRYPLVPSSLSNARTKQWVFSMSQDSQSDFAVDDTHQNQNGGSLESYGTSHDNAGDMNLSDSTHASVASEPVVKSRYVLHCWLGCD